ncbi:hypothetical protein [Ferruginibacter sp.]|uniref:hypothetical protein n=1 Tax=Ferruginibacter sp. TaxID=1940288 RepID=UPI00265ACCAC|nr:hypothetical protein [Ferruginibacter sp.]
MLTIIMDIYQLLPGNVSSRASALARDVAYYDATSIISPAQRPQPCCKSPLKDVAGKIPARAAKHHITRPTPTPPPP